ncbi:hypothetical protein ACSTJG_24875, partial [Vibrio parahaemolyticus]
KVGLRVYAIDQSLEPFIWVNNSHWYTEQVEDRAKRPPIDFVVLDNHSFHITRDSVVRALGEPIHEASFGGQG